MEKRLSISEKVLELVVRKLTELPYGEVAQLIGAVQNDVKPIEEKKKESDE